MQNYEHTSMALDVFKELFEGKIDTNQEITERFTEEHIELYKMLIKYHNNFKSIGNMYKKRNPKLTETVYGLANEIKGHLKKFQ